MTVKKKKRQKSARLNLLISPDLKEWAHGFAIKKEKSISALITDYLVYLREIEDGPDVEQI